MPLWKRAFIQRGPVLQQAARLLEITSTKTLQESADWMAAGETLLQETQILHTFPNLLSLALSRQKCNTRHNFCYL